MSSRSQPLKKSGNAVNSSAPQDQSCGPQNDSPALQKELINQIKEKIFRELEKKPEGYSKASKILSWWINSTTKNKLVK